MANYADLYEAIRNLNHTASLLSDTVGQDPYGMYIKRKPRALCPRLLLYS